MIARNMEDLDLVLDHTNGLLIPQIQRNTEEDLDLMEDMSGLMPQIQRDTEEVDQDLVHMNG